MITGYREFRKVQENEEDLLLDLEDLGFGETKYSEDMIDDAMKSIEPSEYCTLQNESSYEWVKDQRGPTCTVTLEGEVVFSSTCNQTQMWDDLEKSLGKLNPRDYDRKYRKWTLEEVKDAFFDVDWDDEANKATKTDHIELLIVKPYHWKPSNEIELEPELSDSPSFDMTSSDAAALIIKNLP
jgi:hypothetical protein